MSSRVLYPLFVLGAIALPAPVPEAEPQGFSIPGLPTPTGSGGNAPFPTFGGGGGLPSFSLPAGGLPTGFPGGFPSGGLPSGGLPSLSLPFPAPSGPAGGLPAGGLPSAVPTLERRQLGGAGGLGGLGGGLSGLGGLGGGSLPTGLPSGGLGGLGGGSGGLGGLGGGALPTGLPSGGLGGLGGGSSGSIPGLGSGSSGLGSIPGLGGSSTVSARQGGFSIPGISGAGSDTSNDLTSGSCKPLIYIFARGTSESGNMGSTVGPQFAAKLKSSFGDDQVAVQGVDYPADVSGAISGSISPQSAQGATKMRDLVNQAKQKCASSKILISGYSQGAQQVHGALMDLQSGDVDAAVTFGDPLAKTAFKNIDASKTKVFCASGDAVCEDGTFTITPAHLSYGTDSVGPAADFVKSVLG